jgi:hypothetical protein
MIYRISTKQKEKTINLIQKFINSELEILKKYSEDGDLSYDEAFEVDSIDEIRVVDVEKKEGWVILVDIYKNTNRYSFEGVLYNLSYDLRRYIGMNSVNERNVIDNRTSGPGIDW